SPKGRANDRLAGHDLQPRNGDFYRAARSPPRSPRGVVRARPAAHGPGSTAARALNGTRYARLWNSRRPDGLSRGRHDLAVCSDARLRVDRHVLSAVAVALA